MKRVNLCFFSFVLKIKKEMKRVREEVYVERGGHAVSSRGET